MEIESARYVASYVAVEVWISRFPDFLRLTFQISRMNLDICKFIQTNVDIWKFDQRMEI